MNQRLMNLKMKGSNHSIQVVTDSSLNIDDFLENHGLMPRDGGLRYALDSNDNVLKNRQISEVPDTLILGLPEQILPIWVERVTKQGVQTKTVLENGDELYVPGLKADEFCHVFVSRTSKSQQGVIRKHGYRFRTDGISYNNGDHVYIRIPRKGDKVGIFDPETGIESRKLRVVCGNSSIDSIRGLWCVCTYSNHGSSSEFLQYQPQLTFIPPNFKPISAKQKPNNTNHSTKQNPQNSSKKQFGTVKYFDHKKGFGFITSDSGEKIFFHKSKTYGRINRGMNVKFKMITTKKGSEAVNVTKAR